MPKKFLSNGIALIRNMNAFFMQGWKAGLTIPYLKVAAKILKKKINHFHHAIAKVREETHHVADEKMGKLKRTTAGLYSILPAIEHNSYSILVVLDDPQATYFETCLDSAINQSVKGIEILIGIKGKVSTQIEKLIQKHSTVKTFIFSRDQDHLAIINQLASQVTKNYFIILHQHDWLRPDTFFRFEQTLRMISHPKTTVLYCDEKQLNPKNYFLPLSDKKKKTFHFPYFFEMVSEKGFLYPTALWRKVGGLREELNGAEYEDLLLRFDGASANFQHIPLSLYAFRNELKNKSYDAFKKALIDSATSKQLDWTISNGFRNHDLNVQPKPNLNHIVHVIIPFKDQKELTVKCVESLLKQKQVRFRITAIDNNSSDQSIAEEIEQLGGEVLKISEPFNYSRLNNLAVKNSRFASECDVLFFLNNDVELEPNALIEMIRWIDQPHIGMVGCRLHYPDGTLQHGGVQLDHKAKDEMLWKHIEKAAPFAEVNVAKNILITDAVTAACCLVKKDHFMQIGGFDEIWYPIGCSDTNLAVKLNRIGLLSLYTPYSVGIHHESVSRKEGLEDYEKSWWLHELYLKHVG